MRPLALIAVTLTGLAPTLVQAEDMRTRVTAPNPVAACPPGAVCSGKLSARQLLNLAQQLILAKRYDEARPLLAALESAPDLTTERQFLQGYVAVETGDLKSGEKKFRAVLDVRPEMTRARVELARALYLQGHNTAADYHFRVSQRDQLPAEVAQVVSQYRRVIHEQRPWRVNMSFGFAPDSNFTSSTSDRSVDLFGLPFDLSEDARRKSGVGQTAAVSGSVRLRMTPSWAIGVEGAGRVVNYRGTTGDDVIATVAIGPQTTFGETQVKLAATGTHRWYGGRPATRLVGAQFSASRPLGDRAVGGLELSARSINNFVNDDYDGWQFGAAVSYERALGSALAASISLFGKHEALKAKPVSSVEAGVALGFGGELPLGLNAGTSVQVSRVRFGGIAPAFGERRSDWRVEGQASLTMRKLRLAGFSPMVSYTYANIGSSIGFYGFDRHRVEFSISRSF